MSAQSAIPQWLQWAWALAGLGVALGGLCWCLFIFWPYLRWSRKMMQQSYELGKHTADSLSALLHSVVPITRDVEVVVAQARKILVDIEKAQLIQRAGLVLGFKNWIDEKPLEPVQPAKED